LWQKVLDRQVGILEVDMFSMPVALLETFEDDLALRAAAGAVVGERVVRL
jgi:hypothetical protein